MLNEVKSLNDECGVFGIWGTRAANANDLAYDGLHALQHRGQEGAGISTFLSNRVLTHKGIGLLTHVFADRHDLDQLTGHAALGHIRYATAGTHRACNIQPLIFEHGEHAFGLVHNGNLTNARTLKEHLTTQGVHFQSDSDSELLGDLIEINSQPKFLDRLLESAKQLRGGFAYVLMTHNAMYGVEDPNGIRPLVLGQRADGSYVLASETCALDIVDAKYIRDIQPGEVVMVNRNGVKTFHYTHDTQLAVCSMEYIYFARPDSVMHGVSVADARLRLGRQLAIEHPAKGDVVMGVPNSATYAALGFAQQSHIPYVPGIIKNQYVARTFIEPTQAKRERGVAMKLSVIKPIVNGKNVIMVDDSVVRGTTSKYIIQLLKDNGAKSVQVRIASPIFKYPCFDGIDVQTPAELIGARYDVKGIQNQIGADSLGYLSVPGLVKAVGMHVNNPYHGLCTAYFDGHYPYPIDDYRKGFKQAAQHFYSYVKEAK